MENIRDLKRPLLWLAATMVIIHGLGCMESDGEKEPGTERGPCYSNSTCNSGLVCASGLCVKFPPLDSAPLDHGLDSIDTALPDLPAPEGAPDGPMDAPVPDLPVPDLPTLDLLKDSAPDNGTKPDLALAPDLLGPDLVLDQGAVDQASNIDVGGSISSWTLSFPSSVGAYVAFNPAKIMVDGSGNSYITGYFDGIYTFGSTTLTTKGGVGIGYHDIFVVKIDSGGKFLWAISEGGIWDEYAWSIGVDSLDNIYVAGDFSKTTTIGSTSLTSSGSHDIFVAKMDSGGKVLWVAPAGGPKLEYEPVIAVDSSGNSYITGNFGDKAAFGTTTLTTGGGINTFVAKLDSGGKFLWAYDLGVPNFQSLRSIAVDNMGNSYIATNFDTYAAPGSLSFKSKGSTDIFVAKMDGGGKLLWGFPAGGSLKDSVSSIAVDNSGNSYVTGSFTGTATFGSTTLTSKKLYYEKSDLFVLKLDSNGKLLWAVSAGGTDADHGVAIAVDNTGSSYILGLGGPTTFGGTAVTTSGPLVVKVSSGGAFISAVSSPVKNANSIVMDGSSIYISSKSVMAKLVKF